MECYVLEKVHHMTLPHFLRSMTLGLLIWLYKSRREDRGEVQQPNLEVKHTLAKKKKGKEKKKRKKREENTRIVSLPPHNVLHG